MKCQYCEKPATFHITDLTGESGPQIMHLCEQHARTFLKSDASSAAAASVTGALAKSLNVDTAKEELAELDQKECPICGITFFEFRNTGRLGCSYDYQFFKSDLEPLLRNIHDHNEHVGKCPARASALADSQANLIQLRREMDDAVTREDYERAGQIRDELKRMEDDLENVVGQSDDGGGGDGAANVDQRRKVESPEDPSPENSSSGDHSNEDQSNEDSSPEDPSSEDQS